MKKFALLALALCLSTVAMLPAQEPKFPAPQKEHEWLKQFVGEWETSMEAITGPGQPTMKCKGTIQSRALGGFWVVNEIKSEMAGQAMTGVQTMGYDSAGKKYIGTWVDSMTGHLWKYEGNLDKTGKILTLEANGPSFVEEGKTARFRDVYEFKSKDELLMKSEMQNEKGEWVTFATGNVKRTK